MKRTFYALLLTVATLSTVGFLTETLWLLWVAAWALIGAGLIEIVYRP